MSTAIHTPTQVVITGTSRGIGRALLSTFLRRPGHTIYALNRSPTSSTSTSLLTLPAGEGSQVILVPYDAASPTAATDAVHVLQEDHGVTKLDLVIANAGGLSFWDRADKVTAEALHWHYQLNAVAAVLLFNATASLLSGPSAGGAEKKAQFVPISSATASTALMGRSPRLNTGLPYTMAKCALNHAMVALAKDYPQVVVKILTPGRVMTEFGGEVVMKTSPGVVKEEDSVKGLVGLIDAAGDGDQVGFYNWDGKEVPW